MKPNRQQAKPRTLRTRASITGRDEITRCFRHSHTVLIAGAALLLAGFSLEISPVWAAVSENPTTALPDAPQPQIPPAKQEADPCQIKHAGAAMGSLAAESAGTEAGIPLPAVGSPSKDTDIVPCPSSA
ncbi:MAG: hypothetical protein WBQ94_01400, partial [Terracidiphilus sp.]